MKIIVLKFGGTSVGTTEKIKKVAKIISNYIKKKYKVVVISSAMSGVTNDLINKSKKISDNFSHAEYDVLLSSGEQIACSLIAGRLIHEGLKSRSWLAWQIPILTNGPHKNARISLIDKKNQSVHEHLFVKIPVSWKNDELKDKWEKLFTIKQEANIAIEEKRSNKEIGSSLEAELKLTTNEKYFNLLEGLDLAEYFITSKAEKFKSEKENEIKIEVKKTTGTKCPRCWKILEQKCKRCEEVIL